MAIVPIEEKFFNYIWNVLFFFVGNVSSSTFDITLMMVFFRNIAKLSIGNQLPLVIDTSTVADLTRIVFYRNKSAHDAMETNEIQDFEKAYNEISEV